MNTLISVVGIIVLLVIAILLSSNRRAIRLRTVVGALLIQILIGAFILYVPTGRNILLAMANGISNVINYGNEGIKFLFGGLATEASFKAFGNDGFIFAVRVLPIIVFFSALISLLYYVGIMQWIIKIIGGGLQKALGTSKAESMSAAANILGLS
ncbi:nucleoside permease [Avibacterium paragallinarum]|uniref:Nucleoside transporter n=1 Tax=Avibacterium paragallinarum TaxID=728 RepID=A0A377I6H5_AVIPA|nr:nucleoside permease [Avibacterium paragallinarum]RZN75054.1 nucleoside permease [Avibacterium paragallinarum]STO70907.1 nucleoside transporter [Avibacterium paragallinarum]